MTYGAREVHAGNSFCGMAPEQLDSLHEANSFATIPTQQLQLCVQKTLSEMSVLFCWVVGKVIDFASIER